MAEIVVRQSEIRKLLERGKTLGNETLDAAKGQVPSAGAANLGCTQALVECWRELDVLIDTVQMLYFSELSAVERAMEAMNAADQTAARSIEQS